MSEDPYQFWKDSMAGLKPKLYVDDPRLGFYRKPIKERNDKGNNKRVGWEPIAIFMVGNIMAARVGVTDITGDALNELWSYVAGNPISEEWFRTVYERGEAWPDAAQPTNVPAANRDVAKSDNASEEVDPDKAHAAAIDAAIGAAPATVKSDAEAAVALGSKNRIAELRLAADKAGKAIYEPIYRTYTAEQKKWSPIINRAAAKEKELNTAILSFRESERQRIAKEQAEADRKQREIDEANARAADRAIARGEPEPMPEVEEVAMPTQAAPIVATYGTRKIKEEVKLILDRVTNWNALCTYYVENETLQALLMKLAAADIKAGRTVPGTVTREGLI
jgi:hypothetical protein